MHAGLFECNSASQKLLLLLKDLQLLVQCILLLLWRGRRLCATVIASTPGLLSVQITQAVSLDEVGDDLLKRRVGQCCACFDDMLLQNA